MITTTNIIRFRFSNGEWALKNKPYNIYMAHSGGWRKLFTGLTFFNNKGISDIYIDPILRDYVFRWETEYYDDQLYRPKNYLENVNTIVQPIESTSNSFVTTSIKVSVGEVEELEQIKDITSTYSSFFENNKFEVINPFDVTKPKIFQSLTEYNKIIPHIPNCSTDKFWFGLNFSTNSAYGATQLFLRSPNGAFEIKKEDFGNYAVAYSLKTLKSKLNYGDERSGILLCQNPTQLSKNDQSVAIIDSKCDTADFYVAFTFNYGWFSYGFKGNVYQTIEDENLKIENSFGEEEIFWNKTKCRFKLNTSIISEDVYKSLMAISKGYKVYVYDVKSDKGSWCTLTSKSIEGNPNVIKRKPIHMEIELVENKYQIA